jgi:hypothetical protein
MSTTLQTDRPATAESAPIATIGSLELVNQIGMKISLNITDMSDAYVKMRLYGANGWTSGELPSGGLRLPYEMALKFDWRLIGGMELTLDNEDGVLWRGEFYKRREFAAQTTGKKMGAKIKYSRGAKAADPPHLKEGDESGTQYVTLATFSGKARVIPALMKPGN